MLLDIFLEFVRVLMVFIVIATVIYGVYSLFTVLAICKSEGKKIASDITSIRKNGERLAYDMDVLKKDVDMLIRICADSRNQL